MRPDLCLALALGAVTAGPLAAARNDWYRDSRVWIHCDNHSSLLGQGLPPETLAALFAGLPCDLIQVSGQSNGFATYPAKVGTPNPQAGGYDTLAAFRELCRAQGRRLGVYLSVDRRPREIAEHPEWAAREADGSVSINGEPIVCQRPNRPQRGYLYERFLPQIREILAAYDPAALWFDGDYILPRPCWCERCLAEWRAETGGDAPRAKDSPGWDRWVAWHQQRYREYRRLVAEAIHQASPTALYTSNWSWAWTPEPVPDFVDTLSGDAWSVKQVHQVVQRWGAQTRTPWDQMSFLVPGSRAARGYSFQRTLQEGALTLAHGGRWCLWAVGADLPPAGVEAARFAAQWAQDRRALTGPSEPLAQVAVLDSETALAAGYRAGADSPAHQWARALHEAGYLCDLVNEVTWREQRARYRVVVLVGYPVIADPTLADLRQFAAQGGSVLVVGGALRSATGDESAAVADLLGLRRSSPAATAAPAAVTIAGRAQRLGRRWDAELTTARAVVAFADGSPALSARSLGQGQVACLLSDGVSYPDTTLCGDLLETLGQGPSYRVERPTDAAVLATLRQSAGDPVLHLVDLSARGGGAPADVDTGEETQWNPSRDTSLRLGCAAAPTAVAAVPAGVRVETRLDAGVLTVRVWPWQTHAAVRLRGAGPFHLLPADPQGGSLEAAFHPDRHRVGPVFSDDFAALAVGAAPAAPWRPENRGGTSITAAADPADPSERCLAFQDRDGSSFWPYLHRGVPVFTQGAARLRFDLRCEAGAAVVVEVRYEGVAPGPSLSFRDGRLTASGREVARDLPLGQWLRVTVTLRLGLAGEGYDVAVAAPGRESVQATGLPFADRQFTRVDSVYVVGAGDREARFQLARVRFERLAE